LKHTTKEPLRAKALRAYAKKRDEPEWLQDWRMTHLENVSTLEWPKPQKTNIVHWPWDDFVLPEQENQPLLHEHSKLVSLFAQENIFVEHNGQLLQSYLNPYLKQKGVRWLDFTSACTINDPLLKKYWTISNQKPDRLLSQHHALATSGFLLYVPKGVHITTPLQALLFLSGEQAASFSRLIIVAEQDSKVELTTTLIGTKGCTLSNSLAEVHLAQGAQVKIATLSNLPATAIDVSSRCAYLKQDSTLAWSIINLSQGRTLSRTTTYLEEPGSSSSCRLAALGTQEAKGNLTCEMLHQAPATKSHISARAVLTKEANAILNCLTKILKGSSMAHGEQDSKILLLHPGCRGDINPILLIDEQDVQAAHAASIGAPDPSELYYLMSRGLSKIAAERLLSLGFLSSMLPTENQPFYKLTQTLLKKMRISP
jgi:Fe-S cluster assembly protein SufD